MNKTGFYEAEIARCIYHNGWTTYQSCYRFQFGDAFQNLRGNISLYRRALRYLLTLQARSIIVSAEFTSESVDPRVSYARWSMGEEMNEQGWDFDQRVWRTQQSIWPSYEVQAFNICFCSPVTSYIRSLRHKSLLSFLVKKNRGPHAENLEDVYLLCVHKKKKFLDLRRHENI